MAKNKPLTPEQKADIEALIAEAIAKHEEIIASDLSSLEKAFEAGKKLNKAKGIAGHGRFGDYLTRNWEDQTKPGRSSRTARRYMRLAKYEERLKSNWPHVANFDTKENDEPTSIRAADKLCVVWEDAERKANDTSGSTPSKAAKKPAPAEVKVNLKGSTDEVKANAAEDIVKAITNKGRLVVTAKTVIAQLNIDQLKEVTQYAIQRVAELEANKKAA